jgi:hypothetical protein
MATCAACGADWGVQAGSLYQEWGASFCQQCGLPGAWVGRDEIFRWLKDRLALDGLTGARLYEAREELDRIAALAPDDPDSVLRWQRVRDWAPKAWEVSRPVVVNILGDYVKRHLGL